MFVGCRDDATPGGEGGTATPVVDTAMSAAAALDVDTTWTWQLVGPIDTAVEAELYDVDLVDVPDGVIAELRSEGRTVVCYFSAGSHEDWRPDATAFDVADLGEPLDGWAGERWLDIRSASVRAIVERRLDLAVARGCDGVEPDNVDGYLNRSGFDLTAADQLAFNRFVAAAAHDRGLLVGLKNDLDQVAELVDDFDFAIDEQCHEYDECELLQPFVEAAKPVFNAEYAKDLVADPDRVCAAALAADLRTLLLPLDLDGSFRVSCDDR